MGSGRVLDMSRCETDKGYALAGWVLTGESEHGCTNGQSNPHRLYCPDSLSLGEEGSDEEECVGKERGKERQHHLHARSDDPKCDER